MPYNTDLQSNNADLQSILDSINALPEAGSGLDTYDATATPDVILEGSTAYVNGRKITGTMTNNGGISKTMDGIDTKRVSVPSGYTSGGIVALDGTIDTEVDTQADLIAQIQKALKGKAAVGGSGEGGSDDSDDGTHVTVPMLNNTSELIVQVNSTVIPPGETADVKLPLCGTFYGIATVNISVCDMSLAKLAVDVLGISYVDEYDESWSYANQLVDVNGNNSSYIKMACSVMESIEVLKPGTVVTITAE